MSPKQLENRDKEERIFCAGTIWLLRVLFRTYLHKGTMASTFDNTRFVRRSKEEKKIFRKQLKASHILLKHEGISTVSQPTKVMLS